MDVDTARRKLTARQFMVWRLFLEQDEWHETHRDDWYAARIAYEVYLLRMTLTGMFSSNVSVDLTLNDFLLAPPEPADKPKPLPEIPEEERRKMAAQAAKARWLPFIFGQALPGKGPSDEQIREWIWGD